jgi:hypothetical protein
MTQKIAATPTLEGKDAYHFLLEMQKPPSKKKIKMLKMIREKKMPILW